MRVMVLAAGKGTRLLPLTGKIPKPIAPVVGKPIIQHIFELLEEAGVGEVYVNVHHLAENILAYYGWETRMNGMTISLTREEELMGTAGGAKRVSDRFDETFMVVMGDVLTDVDLRKVVAFHKERQALATLVLTPVADTSQYGVVELDPEKNIGGFQEKPPVGKAKSNLANTGIYVLEPEVLEYVPEGTFFDFANDVFPRLLAAGETFVGYESNFYWSDIGTLEAYRQAQRDVLSGKLRVQIPGEQREEGLWVDRDTWIHPTAAFEGQVAIGQNVSIGQKVALIGDVTVGSGCQIGYGATIEGSTLLPGSYIGKGAYLEGCIVGPGYAVQPAEQIRGETLVQNGPTRSSAVRRLKTRLDRWANFGNRDERRAAQ
jgi:mannose-1-phosphate guanylyltransferase